MWKQGGSSLCRLYQKHDETIMYIVSGCDMLCGMEYLYKNENIGAYLYCLIYGINGVSQERRRTVNPLRGKTEFLVNETVKVNPNGGKQGGIPKKESPGIVNNKSDPNGRQKELVPRRLRGHSNKNPSGIKSAVPAKAKKNPQRESPFKFYNQVLSKWAPKGNKFLSACRNFLCTVGFLRRSESEQKWNHSEASPRDICSSRIS